MKILVENVIENLKDEIWDLYDKYTYLRDDRWEKGTEEIAKDVVSGEFEFAEDAIDAADEEELRMILSQYKDLEARLYGSVSKREEVARQIKEIFDRIDEYDEDFINEFWDIINRNGGALFYDKHYYDTATPSEELKGYLSTVSLEELTSALKELKAFDSKPKKEFYTKEEFIAKYYDKNASPSKEEKYVLSDIAKSTGGRTWGYDIDYYTDDVRIFVDLYTDTGDGGLYKADQEINSTFSDYIDEYWNKQVKINRHSVYDAFSSHWDDGYPCLEGHVTLLVALIRAYESGDFNQK